MKTRAFDNYTKEEWELVRMVDYLSDKFFLDKNNNASLTQIAEAIKSSKAFKERFQDTSLARLTRHISWLVHRGGVEGKVMTHRGLMPDHSLKSLRGLLMPSQTASSGSLTELQRQVSQHTKRASAIKEKISLWRVQKALAPKSRAA